MEQNRIEIIADFIYNRIFCRNIKKERQLKWAYKLGMVSKKDLIDGATYFGICRNSDIAKWNKITEEFDYMRTGHFPGDDFEDSVACVENATKNEDIFIPMFKHD